MAFAVLPAYGPPYGDARVEWLDAALEPAKGVLLTTRRECVLDCAGLTCLVAITRIACRSRYLYDIDSVNFGLALDRFSPRLHQPHPPGYFLYVCAGRLFRLLFPDANNALVALSVVASCAAAIVLYLFARNWFGRTAGLFAGLIFLFSPLCWFHGTVALTYIVELFFSALVGYLCWRADTDGVSWLLAAAALGISAGFRPSSLLFLSPLWLFSLRKAGMRNVIAAAALLGVALLAWWIPMLHAAGGARAYFAALNVLWRAVPAKQAIGGTSPMFSVARVLTIAGLGLLCFGCASAFVLQRRSRTDPLLRKKVIFTWIWMGPGLLFFTFVFLLFVNGGYLLVLSPPVFAWLGGRAADWWAQHRAHKAFKSVLLVSAALLNTSVFLFAPFYCSFRSVRQFEAELTRTTRALRSRFDPADTMIVGFDSHFLGYRHAAYYLPEFLAVEYPAVSQSEGKRIFAVHERRTELLTAIPASRFRQFVFLPLPTGRQYREYEERQQARFPAGVLSSQGHDPVFTSGAIASLRHLFPSEMLSHGQQRP
ncbi:MAG TPA: DUF2723 domain-containing protein [Bryobacteraceae bacterium]|nr:DUF2723 domain-containing protein [Bryobacteraceae bacterium]